MAMALSKTTAASGYVLLATAKNELCPRSIRRAHRDRKYNPIPEVHPANIMTHTPMNTPIADMVAGIAKEQVSLFQIVWIIPNIPAPTIS